LKRDFYQEDEVFLADSQELNDTDFVKTLYLTFLKREADEGGLAGKVKQLADGGVSRQNILCAVRTSGEAAQIFVNLTKALDDQAFLEIAYPAYLKQSLSSQDKAAKLAALKQGKSRQEVLISSSI
jgi:acylphosphatase